MDDHLLILPVTHHQAAAHLPDSVTDEIHKYPFLELSINFNNLISDTVLYNIAAIRTLNLKIKNLEP